MRLKKKIASEFDISRLLLWPRIEELGVMCSNGALGFVVVDCGQAQDEDSCF